jgi:hypothetical protein
MWTNCAHEDFRCLIFLEFRNPKGEVNYTLVEWLYTVDRSKLVEAIRLGVPEKLISVKELVHVS